MSLALVTYSHGKTVGDLVTETLRLMRGNQRDQLNRLDAMATTGATELLVGFALDGIRPGAYLEVGDELMFVWQTQGYATAVVQRAMEGTTAAQHNTSSMVYVEPRFPRAYVLQALKDEIASWPGNVYARYVGELSVGTGVTTVDAAGLANVEGASLLYAQRSPWSTDTESWPALTGARLLRMQDTTDFPSGYAFHALGPVHATWDEVASSYTVRVRVSAPFDLSTWTTATDLGDLGLPAHLLDIPAYGAAARLLSGRDIVRTDPNAQGRSRPAEEVRTGEQTQISRALWEFRNQRLAEAAKTYLADDGWRFAS